MLFSLVIKEDIKENMQCIYLITTDKIAHREDNGEILQC